MAFFGRDRKISPGSLVTAAFIGPGTITTCIKVGYTQSYSLLGVMIIATTISIVIQYYAAKVGIITQCGISRNIRLSIKSKVLRFFSCLLIICAIFVGNCAFEAGNITGAALGGQLIFDAYSISPHIVCVAIVVGVLLWSGRFTLIEHILKIVVLLMAACFILSAIIVSPNVNSIVKGMFSLHINGNIFLIGALVGTTIGPYSIFLHSEAASQCWHSPSDIKHMMMDTIVSIAIGGVISCCIIIVSAGTANMLEIHELTISNFSKSMELPLGLIGQKIFLIGLIAAGISSAITAPLAAAYTVSELFTQNATDTKSALFRCVWGIVLLFGTIVSLYFGPSPTNLIMFAQYANALILPLIMIFLFYSLNSQSMGKYRNALYSNIILVVVILVSILLGVKNFF